MQEKKELSEHDDFDLVRQNGYNLRKIPFERQTERMKEIAVSNYGLALEYCKYQTVHIVELAVRENPMAVKYAQEEYLTNDLKFELLEKNPKLITSFKHPTEEMYLFCLKLNGMILRFMKFQTYEMCKQACSTDGRALQFIHPVYQTSEVISLAVSQNPLAKQYLDGVGQSEQSIYPDRIEIPKALPFRPLKEEKGRDTKAVDIKPESTEDTVSMS